MLYLNLDLRNSLETLHFFVLNGSAQPLLPGSCAHRHAQNTKLCLTKNKKRTTNVFYVEICVLNQNFQHYFTFNQQNYISVGIKNYISSRLKMGI